MEPTLQRLLAVVVLSMTMLGCAGVPGPVGDRVDQLVGDARELTDRARFCLAITRAANAIESGSPTTAQEAAEEVRAQVPDELTAEADRVIEELRRAFEDGDPELRSEELRTAAEALRERTLELCDPS